MMNKLFLILSIIPFVCNAGEAKVSWQNAQGIARTELAIGSCLGEGYGLDITDEDGNIEYTNIPSDKNEALISRLEEGEVFCFRARHISLAGVPSSWTFLGKKVIPLDIPINPPTLPQPDPPTSGQVQ